MWCFFQSDPTQLPVEDETEENLAETEDEPATTIPKSTPTGPSTNKKTKARQRDDFRKGLQYNEQGGG